MNYLYKKKKSKFIFNMLMILLEQQIKESQKSINFTVESKQV